MLDEDLSVFFADWGEAAELDGQAVTVIHGAPGEVLPLGGAGMAGDAPRALIPFASIPARTTSPADTDPVLVYATVTAIRTLKRWIVREVRPDGTGLATLMLAQHPDQS